MRTHFAIILSSGRIVPVERAGRLLLVMHPRTLRDRIAGVRSVSTVRHDGRLHLLPASWKPRQEAGAELGGSSRGRVDCAGRSAS